MRNMTITHNHFPHFDLCILSILRRRREAFEKERDKLKEFIAREGKKFDTPQHQAQRKMKMKQLQQLEAGAEAELDEESELVMSLPSPFGVFDKNEKLISIQNVSFAWRTSYDYRCLKGHISTL